MKINSINQDISVSTQIHVKDVAQIKQKGFKTILCNRPDHEDQGQTTFEAIKCAAIKNGLQAIFQPVNSSTLYNQVNSEQFKKYLQELSKPIFAYCRTGTRSATLWSLSQIGDKPIEDILAMSRQAGYSVSLFDPTDHSLLK